MTDPVDLQLLREITDGDAELEASLFDMFIESSDDCLRQLHQSLSANDNVMWRAQAHAWKGSSVNLGAMALGDLCKQAQDGCEAPIESKRLLLAEIEKEYAVVQAFLADKRCS